MAIILESADGGMTKTKLLASADITSSQLRQYLGALIEKKLVIELADADRKHVSYRTTEKGLAYLTIYQSMRNVAVFPKSD